MDDIYPKLEIPNIQNPNRLYAVPILGYVIKVIMIIPVALFAWLIMIGMGILVGLINPFVVLFTGKYWDPAYNLTMSLLRYLGKIMFFFAGLTDRYPGFSFSTEGIFTLEMPKPETPSRLFAFPLLGALVRGLLMIPYYIYVNVLAMAMVIGMICASFVVLAKGRYPESIYEITRDYLRVNSALLCYTAGLSDKYPSFWISMNHKNIKIALLIAGTLYVILNFMSGIAGSNSATNMYPESQNTLDYENNINLESDPDSYLYEDMETEYTLPPAQEN